MHSTNLIMNDSHPPDTIVKTPEDGINPNPIEPSDPIMTEDFAAYARYGAHVASSNLLIINTRFL